MVKLSLAFSILLAAGLATAQVRVGEVLILSHPELKEGVDNISFQNFVTKDFIPRLNADNQPTFHLLKADRGNKKGSFLIARSISKIKDANSPRYADDRKQISSGKEGLQGYIKNPSAFSEYHLLGAESIRTLPTSGILGLHLIKVKKERSKDFETLVQKKLHPAVSELFPDMQMLYYKCVAGENAGSYLTLFTIDSPAARHKYWPEGSPETEVLKKRFKPLEGLAKELGTYFEPGSFLEPESGGAAAYWESKDWTDYVHVSYLE